MGAGGDGLRKALSFRRSLANGWLGNAHTGSKRATQHRNPLGAINEMQNATCVFGSGLLLYAHDFRAVAVRSDDAALATRRPTPTHAAELTPFPTKRRSHRGQ